ncbi:glycosyltransferase family 4 protein [Catenuloplanes atrovinosus]|uniref:Phosphatidylinositol alpha 1,6-mannosyltransferase n=1 Tax=Catenuloplanes atrovinosus TaxID=137266 RepID=A0AAE3YVY4_9ACTN|nr:glycosyltransferase family 1 protein [Catenuloplanes atrovinosus]MDR7279006.1 phosphatidylinositol alpha 1,6-mannosyltransferase [Catenuloplanes atrovinosus]
MRVAIITESFLPDVNGVAHSVVRVAEHLVSKGHEPLVIAPNPAMMTRRALPVTDYPVVRVASFPMLGYKDFRLGLPVPKIAEALDGHQPDVVHLASPFFLGGRGSVLAAQRGLPTVAVYQTDVAAYARLYKLGWGEATAWKWIRTIHNAADRTLAPSTAAAEALIAHGVSRVWLWRRGVDVERFRPDHRSEAVRRSLAPNGELIVGYVGRLAVEKRVDLLARTSRLPGVKVVIVGDGPARKDLEKAVPDALFLGALHGDELARTYASMDIFAHTGPYETFGQTVQEAMASGLPVVAPAVGGPVDLVKPDTTGVLVPPEDAGALADAVADLVADDERRIEFGRAARAAVARRSWAAVGDELIGHYAAVVAGPGVPASVQMAA